MWRKTAGRGERGLSTIPAAPRAAAAILLPALAVAAAVAVAACGTAARGASPAFAGSGPGSRTSSPAPGSSATARTSSRRGGPASHASARSARPRGSQPGSGSGQPGSAPGQGGSGSGQPGPAPSSPAGGNCQSTFVPAYFYSSSIWDQAIDTRPQPAVMLLNVDNGVGTSPLSHFQQLVTQAQAAGITVLGYSSTDYGSRSIGSIETEISEYRSWYGVNGIFLDLTQGTAGEFSYYQALANYIRSRIPGGIVWLNPGAYPDPSFMSIANVVMVFEGPYSSYLSDQVPSWVSRYSPGQFAHVIYDTPTADFAGAVSLSRQRRAGYLFVTDLSGSGNPYGALPSYWSQEASTVSSGC
jgi:hypothetical protein